MSKEQTLPVGISKVSDTAKAEDKPKADETPKAEETKRQPVYVMSLAELERNHIENVLSIFDGNKTKAAKALKISLKTLYNKLHTYGVIKKYENGE